MNCDSSTSRRPPAARTHLTRGSRPPFEALRAAEGDSISIGGLPRFGDPSELLRGASGAAGHGAPAPPPVVLLKQVVDVVGDRGGPAEDDHLLRVEVDDGVVDRGR